MNKPQVLTGAPITNWLWTTGTADQELLMIAADLDTTIGNWKKTTTGETTLAPNTAGWFRTTLPDLTGPGRSVRFEGVDDNGTVYLNGKKLLTHYGWDDPFDVDLDDAWHNDRPNVLTVMVENLDAGGGITKPVTLGKHKPKDDFSTLTYNDSTWAPVHLPHDYVVAGAIDPNANNGHGSLQVMSAWYRRRFNLTSADRSKRIWLYFEGVYRNATIFVNGKRVYFQDDGYDPFNVDITDAVNYGGTNVLAVHVDPHNPEGWWYEGGGIYRHVWLTVVDPVHIVPWGVYVTSKVTNALRSPSAQLTIQTRLTNKGPSGRSIKVTTTIADPDGTIVASTASSHTAAAGQEVEIVQTAHVPSAKLWSLQKRNLYKAVTTITANGNVLDRFFQNFGIRSIRFDPDHGFFLNEKPIKIHGTCNHQDFVGVGIGIPDSLMYWRMKRLRDFLGCNAIRCSHNLMSPAMYDACDELGLLVMDETRHPGDMPEPKATILSTYNNTDHIEKMILRDRNHPSVIMWSLANEEYKIEGTRFGAKMLSALMSAVHKHDKTRPITTAGNAGNDNGWMIGFGTVEDLLGNNYGYQDYDYLHTNYPKKPVFGSETGSDVSCRGIYQDDKAAGHLTSYISPEKSWRPLAEREFVFGGFVWTGFDYRGEPTPYGWPDVSSNFGLLDTCGFPKDAAYYYKAWWNEDVPLVHIFPHWNWAGKEGQVVPVWCFSNCDRVELFVNDVS